MADYGVINSGFVVKRLTEIKQEIETSIRSLLGNAINLLPTAVLGQLVGILSEREALLWELAQSVYNSQYPETAEGSNLDYVASLTGIERLDATRSEVSINAKGTETTIIPQGSIVSVEGNPEARFETAAEAVIGPGVDEVQLIEFSSVPDTGSFTLIFNGEETASLDHTSLADDVEDELNALDALSEVSVVGDFTDGFTITFAGADGEKPQSTLQIGSNTLETVGVDVDITISTTVEGLLPNVDIDCIAETSGAVAALAGTLTVIETVIAGWDSCINALDAEVGKEIESDAEFRIRRLQTLAAPGAGTVDALRAEILEIDEVEAALVYENDTNEIDDEGRPAKSIECVVLGGEEDEIAEAIWNTKPAGIETFGLIEQTITDSQGFDHTIRLSRPTEIPIWLEVDLTTNSLFPEGGTDAVVAAILEYADENFSIGQDVITTRLYCPINQVAGIIDIETRIGIANPPAGDDNIPIADNEISSWDSSRITVTEL